MGEGITNNESPDTRAATRATRAGGTRAAGGGTWRVDGLVTVGFWVAAGFNVVGMLVSTDGLTNEVLFSVDPLFSRGGCLAVLCWGLAFAAQARSWRVAPAVSAAFAVEKSFYAAWWANWYRAHGSDLPALTAADPSVASFFRVYGPADAAFAVFFALAAWRAARRSE